MLFDVIPTFLGGIETHYIQGDLLGNALIEKIVGNLILVGLLPDRLCFLISRMTRILQNGARVGAIKVIPMAGGNHGFWEAKCKHGPLCTFNVEVQDIGAKLFDVK